MKLNSTLLYENIFLQKCTSEDNYINGMCMHLVLALCSPEKADEIFFLQNSTVTIEEFHCKLQEATNFPLRPFVIPFLKVISQ